MTTLQTTRHNDGTWWVENVPAYRVGFVMCTECGPYRTRAEADSDRVGLQRFYRRNRKYAAAGDTPRSDDAVSSAATEPGCLF